MKAARPTAKSLRIVTQCASDNAPSDPKLRVWFASHAKRHSGRVAFDLDLIHRFARADSSILEIGAVPMLLTIPLKTLGYDLECIDLEPARFSDSFERHQIVVHKYDIERHNGTLPDRQFDIVLLNEVFEHLRIDLVTTMKLVRSFVKPAGRLLLSTPNLRSLEGIHNLVVRDRGYALAGEIAEEFEKIEAHGHMGHVREYAPGDVVRFLERIGFTVTELIFRGDTRRFGAAGRLLTDIFPRFRPFVTIVAQPC